MRISCVILTMGDRPAELEAAVASMAVQRGVDLEILVVVNGTAATDPGHGARSLVVGRNLGIPAGRNLGVGATDGELVLFLDDDAWLPDADTLARASERFRADPALGIVSLRIASPEGATSRRHVPRLRTGDPARPSEVTTFLGGAAVVRREVFDRVGGLPEDFEYAHEETSLAWRALDAGYRIHYAGDLLVHHPETVPTRHARARYLSARNRVYLARDHLPAPLHGIYVTDWLLVTLVRDPGGWRETLRGLRDGLRSRRPGRRPIAWRTVFRMARIGRPPLL